MTISMETFDAIPTIQRKARTGEYTGKFETLMADALKAPGSIVGIRISAQDDGWELDKKGNPRHPIYGAAVAWSRDKGIKFKFRKLTDGDSALLIDPTDSPAILRAMAAVEAEKAKQEEKPAAKQKAA